MDLLFLLDCRMVPKLCPVNNAFCDFLKEKCYFTQPDKREQACFLSDHHSADHFLVPLLIIVSTQENSQNGCPVIIEESAYA
ncbi:hypothetical protein LIER_10707 [Lithospermum erythrorhizon]|uniref:Uncharacterized protein n=1 Tax=Lithospermum erythrorhizon TaxID=34254 RepID=A0AAV3PKF1_LITER